MGSTPFSAPSPPLCRLWEQQGLGELGWGPSVGLWACPPPPIPVWRRVSLDGLGATAGGTYASWEDLLRLYFCITSWNRPLGAEVGALSGDTADLEGAGQE